MMLKRVLFDLFSSKCMCTCCFDVLFVCWIGGSPSTQDPFPHPPQQKKTVRYCKNSAQATRAHAATKLDHIWETRSIGHHVFSFDFNTLGTHWNDLKRWIGAFMCIFAAVRCLCLWMREEIQINAFNIKYISSNIRFLLCCVYFLNTCSIHIRLR